MTAADLLTQAAGVYLRGRSQHRDALLETGRLLHAYVLAFLAAGEGMPPSCRHRRGITRRQALADAATKLQTTRIWVSNLIATAMVVELLSGETIGGLSWTSLSLFYRFVARDTGGRKDGSVEVARQETWRVKPAFDGPAQGLFRSAVAEGWQHGDIHAAVLRLYSGPAARRAAPRVHREESSPFRAFHEAAASASPGDLVEELLSAVEASSDPLAVAERLQARLGRLVMRKRLAI